MSFRRLKFTGFTDRRRRQLAKKVDRLERLETRNTITEPISVTGLALSAITGASRLGLIPAFGASNALSGLKVARGRREASRPQGKHHDPVPG